MSDLKIALVTGAGRGIGKETAILLAKKRLNIIICSRTQEELDSTVKEIKSFGRGNVIGRKCDVSVHSQVDTLVNEALEMYGGIDVLINNAGITYVKQLIDTTEEQWNETLN